MGSLPRGMLVLSHAIGLLVGCSLPVLAWGQEVQQVSTLTPIAPSPSFLAALLDAAIASPTGRFLTLGIVTVVLVAGVVEGLKRRFAALRDNSDRARVLLIALALVVGAFLGALGLAPPVPAFAGWLSGVLGGLTCGLLSVAGVTFYKGIVGWRSERAARKAAPSPEGP